MPQPPFDALADLMTALDLLEEATARVRAAKHRIWRDFIDPARAKRAMRAVAGEGPGPAGPSMPDPDMHDEPPGHPLEGEGP